MRILLAGSRAFGRAVYEGLTADGHQVPVVACRHDDGDALFNKVRHRPGVRAISKLDLSSPLEDIDLIVAAHSHDFIGRATRMRARFGAIGYHPSLLPLHRGRDAVRWAVRMGDRVTGGSIYWLNDTVDGGPIAAQRHVIVRRGDTASKLWRRELFPLGVELTRAVCLEVAGGRASAVPQDPELATWEPAIDGAPRLFRPDLPLLGDCGLTLDTERSAAR